MKKIFLLASCFCLAGYIVDAQDTNPNVQRSTETMINGKPYRQYKAEQEQLRQQKTAQVPGNNDNDVITISAAAAKANQKPVNPPAPGQPHEMTNNKPVAAATQTGNNQQKPAAASTATISLADLPMVTASSEDVQAAGASKEAEAKRKQEINKAISQKPVLPETAKTKQEQDIKDLPAAKPAEAPAKLEKMPVKEN